MSIVSIVPTPRELDDSTYSRLQSCFCTSSSSIFEPLFCISSPIHSLILCHIPGTISRNKSSTETSILYSISVLCWIYSDIWSSTWSFSWNRYKFWLILSFGRTFFDSTRNNKFFPYFECCCIWYIIYSKYIIDIYIVSLCDIWKCISFRNFMDDSWNRWNLEYHTRFECIISGDIVCPFYCFYAYVIGVWEFCESITLFDFIKCNICFRFNNISLCYSIHFFINRSIDIWRGFLSFWLKIETDHSRIINIPIYCIIIGCDDRRIIIVRRMCVDISTNKRERGVYRKKHRKYKEKPLIPTKCFRSTEYFDIIPRGSWETSSNIWNVWQIMILEIKSSISVLRDRSNCKTSLHRTKPMSSHISFLWFDFKDTNLITLEVLFYSKNYLWSFYKRSSNFYFFIVCKEECPELDSRTNESLLTINDNWWSIFDSVLFSADFDNCNHNIISYAHIRDSFENTWFLITKRDRREFVRIQVQYLWERLDLNANSIIRRENLSREYLEKWLGY